MQVTYSHCAGLDIHKKTVVACCLVASDRKDMCRETRTYGTTTGELLMLCDWLIQQEVTHIAMESTGEYWQPVYNLLKGNLEVCVVNSRHFKQVPGRKTDVKDAAWLVELLRYGLVRGSFIPAVEQRDLRDLTRQRTTLIQERARVLNRLQKVWEWANLKLAAVVTDIAGVSARRILKALVNGTTAADELAALATGSLCRQQEALQQALDGRVRDHHRFVIATHLEHREFLDSQVAQFNQRIASVIQSHSPLLAAPAIADATPTPATPATAALPEPLSWQQALELADSLPGVAVQSAQLLLAEVGIDMNRFPSAAHLCQWAGVCPGNHESAARSYSGRTSPSNRWLRSILVQMANAAVRCQQSFFASVYRRLVVRCGHKRAIVAVAHRILIAFYHMLKQRQPYQERHTSHTNQHLQQHLLKRLRQQAEQLGYQVQLSPLTPSDATSLH